MLTTEPYRIVVKQGIHACLTSAYRQASKLQTTPLHRRNLQEKSFFQTNAYMQPQTY